MRTNQDVATADRGLEIGRAAGPDLGFFLDESFAKCNGDAVHCARCKQHESS